MLSLILKDFLIQKRNFCISIIFGIVYTFILRFTNDTNMFFLIPTMIAYLFLSGSCSIDEKNNSNILLASLPVERSDMVISKYISSFISLLVGIAITFISVMMLRFIYPNSNLEIKQTYMFASVAGSIFLSSIFFPVYFKLGFQKARYFFTFLFMFFIFVPPLFINFLKEHKFLSIMTFFSNQSVGLLYVITGVILFIVLLISLLISIKLFNNNDL